MIPCLYEVMTHSVLRQVRIACTASQVMNDHSAVSTYYMHGFAGDEWSLCGEHVLHAQLRRWWMITLRWARITSLLSGDTPLHTLASHSLRCGDQMTHTPHSTPIRQYHANRITTHNNCPIVLKRLLIVRAVYAFVWRKIILSWGGESSYPIPS